MSLHPTSDLHTDTRGRRRRTSKNGTHFITPRGLAERRGTSAPSIWRAHAKYGTLPRPVRLSTGRVGWPIDLIERLERAATLGEQKAIVREFEAIREANPAHLPPAA